MNKLLVGNKADKMSERTVSLEQGKLFSESVGIDFMETSAKGSTNVENMFTTIVAQIKSRIGSRPTSAARAKASQKKSPAAPVSSMVKEQVFAYLYFRIDIRLHGMKLDSNE